MFAEWPSKEALPVVSNGAGRSQPERAFASVLTPHACGASRQPWGLVRDVLKGFAEMELGGPPGRGGGAGPACRGLARSASATEVSCPGLVCVARSPPNLLSTGRKFVSPTLSLRPRGRDPHGGFGVLARELSPDSRKSPSSTDPGGQTPDGCRRH